MQRFTCDVLVVGCGAAGLTSALAALEEGSTVVLLERSPKEDRGGNTRWTEAILRLHALADDSAPFQVSDDFVDFYATQAGYHVPPAFVSEAARPYDEWSPLLRALPFLDPELLDTFATGVPETLKWLQSHGVKFREAAYSFIFPAPLYSIYGGGEALIDTLFPIIEKLGATILYEMTAVQLLLDDELGVGGVKAVHSSTGAAEIRAKKTILACGGFEGNSAMLAQYMGPNARYCRPVAPGGWYNKGEGIRLALDIGAAPAGDFAECHRQPIDPRSSVAEALVGAYPFGIVVNQEGQRFMDEAPNDPLAYLEQHCREINAQPQGLGYFIADAKIDEIPAWKRMIRTDQPPIEAGSLDELAAKIGIAGEALRQTVKDFNAACAGSDGFRYSRDDVKAVEAFRRGMPFDWESVFDRVGTIGLTPSKSNWARPIDTAPYRCYPIISSITFTCGGLKTTKDAEVVRTSGAKVPGLYAAGETMGMMFGIYVGATSVLRGLTFGRRAGLHAARSVMTSGAA